MDSVMVETKKPKRKRNAQGMVEFALVAPILVMLMFGIIDSGWLIFNYGQLYNGMREALRYGTVKGYGSPAQYDDCAGMRGKIKAYANFSGVTDNNISIYYDAGAAASAGGYDYDPVALGYNPCQSGSTAQSPSTFDPTQYIGSRVRITIDVPVHFLTPFFNGLFKQGVEVTLTAGRTISGTH